MTWLLLHIELLFIQFAWISILNYEEKCDYILHDHPKAENNIKKSNRCHRRQIFGSHNVEKSVRNIFSIDA